MPLSTLDTISDALETAVMKDTSEIETPLDLYDLYERIAISLLDSNFDKFPDGVLEEHLRQILESKARYLLGRAP